MGNGADGLIPIHNQAVGLQQPIHQFTSYGHSSPPDYKDDHAYSSAYGSQDEKLAAATETVFPQSKTSKRKRLIWIIIGAILLALAVGLGVGLGVGLSQNDSSDDSTNGGEPDSENV